MGYGYQQLTGDSGEGAKLGVFKSNVYVVGPLAGYFFRLSEEEWYANLNGYYEFSAENRPSGFNAWLTVAIPLLSTR